MVVHFKHFYIALLFLYSLAMVQFVKSELLYIQNCSKENRLLHFSFEAFLQRYYEKVIYLTSLSRYHIKKYKLCIVLSCIKLTFLFQFWRLILLILTYIEQFLSYFNLYIGYLTFRIHAYADIGSTDVLEHPLYLSPYHK